MSPGDDILPRPPISLKDWRHCFMCMNNSKFIVFKISKPDPKPWHSNLKAYIVAKLCENNIMLARN